MLTQRDGTGASRQQKWKAGRRPKDTAEQPGNRQPMVDARNLWLAEHRRNIAMLRHFGRGVVVSGPFQLVPAIRVEFDMDQ